jgi:hypothetical protein
MGNGRECGKPVAMDERAFPSVGPLMSGMKCRGLSGTCARLDLTGRLLRRYPATGQVRATPGWEYATNTPYPHGCAIPVLSETQRRYGSLYL